MGRWARSGKGDVKRLGVALIEELSKESVTRKPGWEPLWASRACSRAGTRTEGLHLPDGIYLFVFIEVELTHHGALVPGVEHSDLTTLYFTEQMLFK